MAKSLRALGREVGACGKTVKKLLENMGIHVRKQQSRPLVLVSELQAMTQRQRFKMVKSISLANRDVTVVMDDETYLTLDDND